MARESQGLQIALIVFVMFTIILGVTTFMFSKEYGKAKALATDSQTKATEAEAAQRASESENMRLKQVVGHAETATLTEVDEEFNKDMQTFAQNYNDANLSYKTVCQWLFDEVQRKNAALSAEKERVQQVKDQNAFLEAAKEDQIQQLTDRAKKAEEDLAAERAKFNASQAQLVSLTNQQQQANAKIRQDSQVQLAQKTEEVDGKTKEIDRLTRLLYDRNKKIDEMDPVVVDLPDGSITYAGQGDIVQIDLGYADGLSLLTDFAVYERDTTDLTTAGRKGAVEVIQLLGPHTASARITEDIVSNPILPGDKVFTPLWKKGQRERFALTDGMDLNGDGRSDLQEVINLIRANGGDVDYYIDDAGKQYGEVTGESRYLVLGKQPDEGNTMERINGRKAALKLANDYGLRPITLEELLNRMGFVRQTKVIRYDTQSDPNDFRAKAPEGVPRDSSRPVSGIFQERNPPTQRTNSAY